MRFGRNLLGYLRWRFSHSSPYLLWGYIPVERREALRVRLFGKRGDGQPAVWQVKRVQEPKPEAKVISGAETKGVGQDYGKNYEVDADSSEEELFPDDADMYRI